MFHATPTVLYTGSGNKRDFLFFDIFLFALVQYPLNVNNNNNNNKVHTSLMFVLYVNNLPNTSMFTEVMLNIMFTGDDAQEEEDEEGDGEEDEDGKKNPFASASEELHLDDPKKTLRGWFERHGYDPPNYILEEISPGCCRCSVE